MSPHKLGNMFLFERLRQPAGSEILRKAKEYYKQQKYSEAEALFRNEVNWNVWKYGKHDQDTLRSKNWLGKTLFRQQKYNEAEGLFQQVVHGQEQILGKDDKETLESKSWLGSTLHWQQKYNEAERMLQEAVDGQEHILGKDDKDTLESKSWLGSTLHRQQKYYEAERILQEAVDGQEHILGKDDENTLESKYWLGKTLYRQQKYNEAEGLLQQVVDGREQILAKDDKDTLESKYWLGSTLHRQQKYNEAERILQEAVDGQEHILGKDDKDTLKSKYWLGKTLYRQQKYNEAEGLLQQVVDRREQILGKDDKETLESKYWLGITLYRQQKYNEAEGLLQQVVDGREQILGKDDKDTLRSKYWLGITLHWQQKYNEAEGLLQQVVDRWEQILGKDDEDTLRSKYWLGSTLHQQQKYNKAERLFQQVVDRREQILGKDDEDTLESKYWLGITFHQQQKYYEAEGLLQQVVDRWEQILGKDDENTLESKFWLGKTLYRQQKYNEAKGLYQQSVDDYRMIFGRNHEYTRAAVRMLEASSSRLSPPDDAIPQAPSKRLDSFFVGAQRNREQYTDPEINEISRLLKYSNQHWSKVPRTYIILRTISHQDLLDGLINVGFSDYWLPVTERSLPDYLPPHIRASFVTAQNLVLTKSTNLEKGQHCNYKEGESPPFETKGVLGSGGFGQVERVVSLISFKDYARKQVLRSIAFRGRRKEAMKQFITEISILKRLKHHHIVKLIGSYTDSRYIALIMSPIAEMDLAAYLERATICHHPELRTFFGCLATALDYLHLQKIRHKDIKPGNILVNHGTILLADFGLSFDWLEADYSTTTSRPNGMSPRYCAPEVVAQQPRNTASDVWSLGVVFMEMIMILKGKTIRDMDDFFSRRGSQHKFIHANLDALPDFITELEATGDSSDNRALGWAQQMLCQERQSRTTASSLVGSILSSCEEMGRMTFCGICCAFPDDDHSDWTDELESQGASATALSSLNSQLEASRLM